MGVDSMQVRQVEKGPSRNEPPSASEKTQAPGTHPEQPMKAKRTGQKPKGNEASEDISAETYPGTL